LAVLEIVTFLVANGFRAAVADVACIAVNESFIAMKPVCCYVQLMHVGAVLSTEWTRPDAASNPMWQRIP
jgi:hypothetical protein